jgi:hypothetical protein
MSEFPRTAVITPLPDRECEIGTCSEPEHIARVAPATSHAEKILCPTHRAEYLNKIYNK